MWGGVVSGGRLRQWGWRGEPRPTANFLGSAAVADRAETGRTCAQVRRAGHSAGIRQLGTEQVAGIGQFPLVWDCSFGGSERWRKVSANPR